MSSRGTQVSFFLGPLIRTKAKEIAGSLGNQSFNASSGWLAKFRARHNITFKAISGEAASVNYDDVASFLEKLPSLIRGYSPSNIYNADETGLFFRALPNKTLTLKNEKCIGGKLPKERVTILHCANMNGDKEKLLVIGKANKPRAFKHINPHELPVTWKSNKKAWMTMELMKEWLEDFDFKLIKDKRKILLFLDNAGSHPKDSIRLKNIKIIFLPPNCTAVCQPLDQGIIKNFKSHYRTLILKSLLVNIETCGSAYEITKKITLLDAVYFAQNAWNQVTKETIQNCFRKAGFKQFNEEDENQSTSQHASYDPEDNIPLNLLAEILKRNDALEFSENDIDSFLLIDENLSVECTDPNQTLTTLELNEESEESEDDIRQEAIGEGIPNYVKAYEITQQMKQFALCQGDAKAVELIAQLSLHFKDIMIKKKTRQMTLDEFFLK